MKILMALVFCLNGAFAVENNPVDEVRLRAALENIQRRVPRGRPVSKGSNFYNGVSLLAELIVGLSFSTGTPFNWARARVPRKQALTALYAVVGVTGGLVALNLMIDAHRTRRVRKSLATWQSPEVLKHFFNLELRNQFDIARRDPGLARLIIQIDDAYEFIDGHRGTTTYSLTAP